MTQSPLFNRRSFLRQAFMTGVSGVIGLSGLLAGDLSGFNTTKAQAAVVVDTPLDRPYYQSTSQSLNILTWSNFFGQSTMHDFEKKTNVKVYQTYYSNNAEAFEKIRGGGNRIYDLVIPAYDWLPRYIEGNLLQKIPFNRLSTMHNINPQFTNLEHQDYIVPYLWGTNGIAYRPSTMPKGFVPDSWKWLFDSNRFAGRMTWFDRAQYVFGFALAYLGYDMNSVDEKQNKQALQLLIKQKQNVQAFTSLPDNFLVTGQADIAMIANGAFARAYRDNQDCAYVFPKEGGAKWLDSFAITSGARNINNALAFIDFVQDPHVNARIAEDTLYNTANSAAYAYIAQNVQRITQATLSDDDEKKLTFLRYIGEEGMSMREKLFLELMQA